VSVLLAVLSGSVLYLGFAGHHRIAPVDLVPFRPKEDSGFTSFLAAVSSTDAERSTAQSRRSLSSGHYSVDHPDVVLVTGGAGFIGSHLVMKLLETKISNEVWIIDNLSRGSAAALGTLQKAGGDRLKFFPTDLGDSEEVQRLLQSGENRIHAVFHLAAIAFVPESAAFPDRYHQNITRNTKHLIDALAATQNSVLLYFSSTCAVYGPRPPLPVNETVALNPVSPYGEAKMNAEKAIVHQVKKAKKEIGRKFQARIFRFFNVMGADPEGRLGENPREDLAVYSRLWTACRDVALGSRTHIVINGGRLDTFDGTPERDWVHVSDLAGAMYLTLEKDYEYINQKHQKSVSAFVEKLEKTTGEDVPVFNLGIGRAYSLMEFVDSCRKATDTFIPVKFGSHSETAAISLYTDGRKAERVLGWKPIHKNLTKSLEMAWRFTLSQQVSAQEAFLQKESWLTKSYDVCVVGAGLSGAVASERILNHTSKTILMLEKRNHIGGNVYDYTEEDTGLRVSLYGVHLFHTKKKHVWEYLQPLSHWTPYEHRVFGWVNGQWVSVPVNIDTVNKLFGLDIKTVEEMNAWLAKEQIPFTNEPGATITSETVALSRVGQRLYDMIFKPYTIKQWEKTPMQLEPSVLARIPVRNNWDDRYFTDEFQAYPTHGYTRIFESLLGLYPDRLHVKLNVDYFEIRHKLNCKDTIYTGPIDSYYAHLGFPKLEYRSLSFERRVVETDGYVFPKAQNNYPSLDYNFTRVVEYKHILDQKSKYSSVFYEYSSAHGEPYYPVPSQRNRDLFNQYKEMASKEKDVWFIGRLANYKYYNMDEAIDASLNTTGKYLASLAPEQLISPAAHRRKNLDAAAPKGLPKNGEQLGFSKGHKR
jgi:UDP-galactopyranose mutase